MLNPHWVNTFAALVELGSFTRAADRLGLTQAAVSQHVRQLEDRLGMLLIRRPRRIELTPAGQALLDYRAEVEGAERRLRVRLTDAETASGEVSLITPGSVGLFLYPMLLDLQERQPGLVIRHRFAPDHEVQEAVLNNRFELGLLTAKPDDSRLTVSAFTEEALELVIPAGENVRNWDDLARIGFIDHPDGHAMAARLLSQRYTRSPGIRSLPIHGFSNQVGLILEPVARGLGFSVIPRYARQAFPRAEAIRVVEGGPPVVDTLWLIHRSEWPLPARTLRILEALRGRVAAVKR
ncbi:LysR family transcriptional regulator [Roseomonas gilardii]|uniref:LysR family transcriptional regulator n=1 Tax=Roseomonas gilardii TaxID=257708 RepID=UPI0004B3562C|nr:LysR family transcriptional regulator [Roseomonas gilardii]